LPQRLIPVYKWLPFRTTHQIINIHQQPSSPKKKKCESLPPRGGPGPLSRHLAVRIPSR
jgi:hypothetical protein